MNIPSLPAIVWNINSVGVNPVKKLFDTNPLAAGTLATNKKGSFNGNFDFETTA